ncbi:hypothetical protein N7494_000338 [Penicillium frequentans]|uniref:Uncharacterized protein n=1 Tax=Penicillium frequentans TaxID=3151616 RepID=A0AAD6D6T3_9EURO|nr:hypothetical protein N7494_000338 [Penicillium glabrum]
MSFLVCPRWRRERPVSPSGAGSYNQAQPENSFPRHGQGPAISFIHDLQKKQPESFSHRLRRRFSREYKWASDAREYRKFMFPFPRKSSRSAPSRPKPVHELMSPEYGNSLMSERGYDSDAHYITTPRHDLARSPAGRGFRRMELSDLIEQSQERSEAERWALFNNPTATDSQESAFGMHFIPTPPGTLRGPPTAFHTARETDASKYQPLTHSPLRVEQPQGIPVLNKIFGAFPSIFVFKQRPWSYPF